MTTTEDRLTAALRTGAERITAAADLPGTLVRGRRIRRRRVGMSAVAAVLVLACLGATLRSATGVGQPAGSAPSAFHPIASSPLATRVGSSMVSLGSDVFVWGGQAADPRTIVPVYSGEPPPPSDGPGATASPTAPAVKAAPGLLTDGAIYSATSDTWRSIAQSPLLGRVAAPVVVTNAGVLVLGGSRLGSLTLPDLADGALYDPVGNAWTKIPDAPFCVHSAVADGALVYAAGNVCGAETSKTFGVLDAMTGVWKSEPAPPSGELHLLKAEGTVVALGISGAASELSPDGTWHALPDLPGTGDAATPQSAMTEWVTASNGATAFVVGELGFGAGGVVIETLTEGRWTEVGRVAQPAQLAHPPQADTQATFSGDRLVWRGSTGFSWFSLSTHQAGSVPIAGSEPDAMTATQLVPVDGRSLLWWGGYGGAGHLPRTHRLLSAGALVTITP